VVFVKQFLLLVFSQIIKSSLLQGQ